MGTEDNAYSEENKNYGRCREEEVWKMGYHSIKKRQVDALKNSNGAASASSGEELIPSVV